ncbi:MAG TPA: alpha-hydroxy acid oxidase, partial [Burkholderiales bacterium]|nr:alpha-hydroxy acid oxidase [Burkholderiales bacterium]
MANPALSAQNTHDLRELARRRLPRIVFDFIDRGTEEEYTLRRNRDVFERIVFRPRTLVDVSGRSQKTTLFGKEYAMPVGIAPTGIAGIACFEADIALARAAAAQGVPFILSTASTIAMERVMREGGAGTRWFQLYMGSDRDEARKLVERARDAGYEALALTTDVPVQASREYNVRNGFSVPFKLRGRNLIDGLAHPRWLAGVFLRTLMTSGVPRLENL